MIPERRWRGTTVAPSAADAGRNRDRDVTAFAARRAYAGLEGPLFFFFFGASSCREWPRICSLLPMT